MSITPHKNGRIVIALTFIIALSLSLLKVAGLNDYNPPWAMMVVIYWCLAVPARVGIGTAWVVGLFVGFPGTSLLGVHALAFTITAYITLSLYQRIRVSPPFQQAITVFCLLLLYSLLIHWFDGFSSENQDRAFSKEFFYPPLVGFILWPLLFFVLRGLRRRFKIN